MRPRRLRTCTGRRRGVSGVILAVIGSRGFTDKRKFLEAMERFFGETRPDGIISGGARGVDTMGKEWAEVRRIPVTVIRPDWGREGRSATFNRNAEVIGACDMVIAFWGGKSAGTRDSLEVARRLKKTTVVVFV